MDILSIDGLLLLFRLVFVFVWFPFWMTGPIIGCVIGYFLGFTAMRTLSIVLAGTFAAIISWAHLLKKLNEQVLALSPYAPIVLLSLIIVTVVIIHRMEKNKAD